MSSAKKILVVGGTGAQGAAVVRVLASTGDFGIILFTRSTDSSQCQELLKLPNVEAAINPAPQGYDLGAFEAAARRSYGVFLNTDGFALGEEAETYWGIRLYETAVKARVQQVVYSGLDDHFRNSGYDPKSYVGHFQGKSRVQGESSLAFSP
ncbi:hypothetical protein M409DRAFT_37678 [Zasmidium cellare ATCC 36951]|uniref:NmrA-like domain-containing protein n=1 Tax=Zasmidium cellare ATCC 36951 TaxID=1080233 RepID=A0A6A6C4H4_ZASCE|nr:uncharacterized protein M409DRAFT_37678 [Zasmidium cellare ATCC 36951]KAF2160639.1 hypothetical protein M409DRAFT_37678 [Zasmidium cellare ATCC 36951]